MSHMGNNVLYFLLRAILLNKYENELSTRNKYNHGLLKYTD